MDGCSAELGHVSADDQPDSPVIPTAYPPSCEDLPESKLSNTGKSHEAPVERVEHACSEMVVNNTIGEAETGKGKRKKRKREHNDGETVKECKADKKRTKKSLSKVGSPKTKTSESSKKKKKKKNRVTLKSLSKTQSKVEVPEKVKVCFLKYCSFCRHAVDMLSVFILGNI